jgi:hypothetical protein
MSSRRFEPGSTMGDGWRALERTQRALIAQPQTDEQPKSGERKIRGSSRRRR